MRPDRPKGWTNRDVLCGVLAAAARELNLPASLDVAAKACEPLWTGQRINDDWFPDISPEHAREAVAYARQALAADAITKGEFDFICAKTRRVLVRNQPTESPDVLSHQNPSTT